MSSAYNQLIEKLDSFIRKYYKNQIIRGVILSLTVALAWILFIITAEYFGHFSVTVRTTVFYTSLLALGGIVGYFIVIPLLKYARIGAVLSYEQAAKIIAIHFSSIDDKLLNTLELAKIQNSEYYSSELILASIEQKIDEIKPVPFNTAIDLRINYKYVKYFAGLAAIFLLLFITVPSVLTEGTQRIVNYREQFDESMPFSFILENADMQVQQGEDFMVKLKIEGDYIPDKVAISIAGNDFLMDENNKIGFQYKIKSINNTLTFSFVADEYRSRSYEIEVLPSPLIIDFKVFLDVPNYTGEQDQVLNNAGDLTVPAGTKLRWEFATKNVDSLSLYFADSSVLKTTPDNEIYVAEHTAMQSMGYQIGVQNEFVQNFSLVSYHIKVIPDLYPGIKLDVIQDSLRQSVFYFKGQITDDYGFSKLSFNYYLQNTKQGTTQRDTFVSVPLSFTPSMTSQTFFYSFDFSSITSNSDQIIGYFFQVWDNDAVHGAKSAKSEAFEFRQPTKAEISEAVDNATSSIKENIDLSQQLASQLNKSIETFRQNTINNNSTQWEQSQLIDDILQKHEQLEDLLKEIAEENEELNDFKNSFTEEEKELLEKQQQIQELLENLLTDEMRDLIAEIEKLRDQMDMNQLNQKTEDLQLSYKDLSEQLDRNMELLKQYEVQEKVADIADQLEELAQKQQELTQMLDDKKADPQALKDQMDENEQAFEDLMEEYEETLDKNSDLDKPMNLDDFDEQEQEINEQFDEMQQNMQDGKQNKSQKNSQQLSEQMQQMAQDMQQMMEDEMQQQTGENIQDLQQILENLIAFSFGQEELINDLSRTSNQDPRYIEIVRKQKKLQDDFGIINDSLSALAAREPSVDATVTKEVMSIKQNLAGTMRFMKDRRQGDAQAKQQFTMTSANNLALLLSEVLEAMMEQMSNPSSGSGDGKQPMKGGQVPSVQQMRQQQESMKQQLQQMLQQMQNGQQPGDQGQMNQQLGKMLSEQEIFENMLNDLMQKGGASPQTQKILNEIRDMVKENQNDLINQNITPETLVRQNQILTRLLEAEDAEQEREQDKKRESKQPGQTDYTNPQLMFEDTKDKTNFTETLDKESLKFYNFYKNKYNDYLLKLIEL